MTLALRSRLTLVYAAAFGMLLLAFGVVSYRVLAYQLDADLDARLEELTSGLHGYLRVEQNSPVVVYDPTDPAETAFVQEASRYYQLFDAASGRQLAASEAMGPLGLQFTPAEVAALREGPKTQEFRTDYGRLRFSNSLIAAGDGHRYLLQVGISLASMDRALHRFLVVLLVGAPAGLIVALAAGRWMAGLALLPLARFAAAARAIDINDLQRRMPLRGAGDELDALAVAFNETLDRLHDAVGEMRQFSAALAHELRTPLAALRGEIELALLHLSSGGERVEALLASQLEEIDKLKRLTDRILTLAHAEAGEIPLATARVNLAELAAGLADQLAPVAEARAIQLHCECAADVVVLGDGEWLKRLALNLLDNAIKFTPDGGTVTVRITGSDGFAHLTVQDTGIGITASAMPHLFERFFRADPARSPEIGGVGLGLSLVKWIADRHRGRIEVQSEPGRGSRFTVHLPLA